MLNYKFRLYPTKEIEAKLVETLEINRIIYNYFVSNNFCSFHDMCYSLVELKEQQPILRNYHSKISRRKKGSRNREKAKSLVGRLHEWITNKGKDFLHKISTEYAKKI